MSSGVHRLVTGLPGAGKTLFAVSEVLLPLVGTSIEVPGGAIERRLCVGGIRSLTIPHELIEVPAYDPDTFKDVHSAIERNPGDPSALPAGEAASILNWWLWAMPGDVIVVDEAQRVFRPMASGRRVPTFIAKLEIARHYGLQFVFITQHPSLIHSNVRNLVGPHEHVSRVWGRAATMVYAWDHCSSPDRIKNAQARLWRHPKSAYRLYKSAELHTKFATRLPVAVYVMALALVCLIGATWYLFRSKPAPAPEQAPLGGLVQGRPGPGGPAAARVFPVMNVAPFTGPREPFADRAVHLVGSYSDGAVTRAYFLLSLAGQHMATLSDAQMTQAGYVVRHLGPCAAVLIFGSLGERPVTCDAPARQPHGATYEAGQGTQPAAAAPSRPASGSTAIATL